MDCMLVLEPRVTHAQLADQSLVFFPARGEKNQQRLSRLECRHSFVVAVANCSFEMLSRKSVALSYF